MNKLKRIILAMVLVVTMIPSSVFAESKPINVTVDGVAVKWTDAAPYVDANNRTMVPLRAIGEAMGLQVYWDSSDKTANFLVGYEEKESVSKGNVKDTDNDGEADYYMAISGVTFTLNNKMAESAIIYFKLGTEFIEALTERETSTIDMDTAAVMKDNRTYAPVKYLAEYFGYTVNWDQSTNTVVLTSKAQ